MVHKEIFLAKLVKKSIYCPYFTIFVCFYCPYFTIFIYFYCPYFTIFGGFYCSYLESKCYRVRRKPPRGRRERERGWERGISATGANWRSWSLSA